MCNLHKEILCLFYRIQGRVFDSEAFIILEYKKLNHTKNYIWDLQSI